MISRHFSSRAFLSIDRLFRLGRLVDIPDNLCGPSSGHSFECVSVAELLRYDSRGLDKYMPWRHGFALVVGKHDGFFYFLGRYDYFDSMCHFVIQATPSQRYRVTRVSWRPVPSRLRIPGLKYIELPNHQRA